MSHQVEQLPLPCMWVGEGPHWLEAQQALVVVDMHCKSLRKHYVETGNTEALRIDGGRDDQKVSMAVPVEGAEDLWVVGLGNTLSVVSWPSSEPNSHTFQGHAATPTTIHTVPDDRFNDAKCDPRGRLWADGGRDDQKVSMAVPVEGAEDLWVVGLGNTLSVVSWPSLEPNSHTFQGHAATPTTIHTVPDDRFNDAKCDPRGRLWAGTMSEIDENVKPLHPGSCHLYRCDHNLNLTACVKDLSLSNGMTWSSDKKHFYHVDTTSLCVYHFDYDDEAGAISNQRVLLDFKKVGLQDQAPDGMTIDQNDNLWLASVFGGQVLCVDPRRGEVVRKVELPAKFTTSVCWGGRDYSTLFVTSGSFNRPDQPPSAGGTFAIKGLGVKGCQPMSFKADLTKLRAKMEV